MKTNLIGLALFAGLVSACNSKPAPAIAGGSDTTAVRLEKNKQTALNTEHAIVASDVANVVKDCAPGFVDYGNGEGKPMTNLDTIKAGLKVMLTAFPDYKAENLKAMASGDSVLITADWSGTFKNAFMGAKPTGKKFKFTDAEVFTFNTNGKITSHRSVQSETTILAQVGMLSPSK